MYIYLSNLSRVGFGRSDEAIGLKKASARRYRHQAEASACKLGRQNGGETRMKATPASCPPSSPNRITRGGWDASNWSNSHVRRHPKQPKALLLSPHKGIGTHDYSTHITFSLILTLSLSLIHHAFLNKKCSTRIYYYSIRPKLPLVLTCLNITFSLHIQNIHFNFF
jgi:hypothetical protein